jgi:hypothetical protein
LAIRFKCLFNPHQTPMMDINPIKRATKCFHFTLITSDNFWSVTLIHLASPLCSSITCLVLTSNPRRWIPPWFSSSEWWVEFIFQLSLQFKVNHACPYASHATANCRWMVVTFPRVSAVCHERFSLWEGFASANLNLPFYELRYELLCPLIKKFRPDLEGMEFLAANRGHEFE